MADKLGLECKLYHAGELLSDTVTPETAGWQEIGNVRDLTLNLSKGEADVTKRENNGWEAIRGTLKSGSIEFDMLWDTEDAAFTALKDAYLNDTDVALAAMSGPIATSGEQGLVANFQVTGFNRNEQLREGVTVSVTVKPHSQIQWYEVA